MIRELSIKNFGLIEDLHIKFQDGFHVIIGESGAGKSMLLDAISSLIGGKCSTLNIRDGKDRYSLYAEFDVHEDIQVKNWLEENGFPWNKGKLSIARELTKEGKSRIFIQDSLASLALLRELGPHLCEIHNQNEQFFLLDKSNQLEFIDRFGGFYQIREEMESSFQIYKKLKKSLEEWEEKQKERSIRKETLAFFIREWESLQPKEGEWEELIQEEKILAHGEKIYENLQNIRYHLENGDESILSKLVSIVSSASKIADLHTNFQPIYKELESISIQLKELRSQIREEEEEIFFSQERLDMVQNRIQELSRLQKKHGKTISELHREYPLWIQELQALEQTEENISSLKTQYNQVLTKIKTIAIELSKKRRSILSQLEDAIQKELENLGMKNTRLQIVLRWEEDSMAGDLKEGEKSYVLYPSGLDVAEYYFSANPGEKPRPLRKVASGGEMSRIMLAIRTLLGHSYSNKKLLVFDEIDSGISGDASVAMAQRLAALGKNSQIFVISHSQIIASKAFYHWKVDKILENGRNKTILREIPESEKAYELARMVTGREVTKQALEHAKAILKKAG